MGRGGSDDSIPWPDACYHPTPFPPESKSTKLFNLPGEGSTINYEVSVGFFSARSSTGRALIAIPMSVYVCVYVYMLSYWGAGGDVTQHGKN